MHPSQKSAAGIIVLLLIALGIYFMLPEIRRYIRRERM
jgi:exosortase/archaeosortase